MDQIVPKTVAVIERDDEFVFISSSVPEVVDALDRSGEAERIGSFRVRQYQGGRWLLPGGALLRHARRRGWRTVSIRARFLRFHAANPQIYDELVRLAQKWRQRQGVGRVGILMFYDVLRWREGVSTTGDSFRLNSNFTAYYARLIMDREPDLRGLFETRKSGADVFGDPHQPALWVDAEVDATWLDEANRLLDERLVAA